MNEQGKVSRRGFLKASTAVSALAAVQQVAGSAHVAGSDVIKVALIGAGGRGTGAVGQLLNADRGLKLIAVADAFRHRAEGSLKRLRQKYKDQVDVPPDCIFAGLKAYQGALSTDCDLVVLATPPGFRPLQYKAAIEAGKHVFMEKPCCVDAPGYLLLMEANKLADQKGLFVRVGLQRRHQPEYKDTIERIQDGAIGKVKFLRVYWNGGGIWNRRREELVRILGREPTEIEYQVHNWYHFCWLSGDNICEQHVHNIDIGLWVMGDQHPVEANGMGGCTARYLGDLKGTGQIFDHHFVEFVFADGTRMYSQCRHMKNCFDSVSEHVHGTEGYANCSGAIGKSEREITWRYKGKRVGGHQQEQTDLVADLRAGRRGANEGYYGANSSMTAVLGREANYSGKIVKWDELVNRGKDLAPDGLAWDSTPPVQKGPDGNYPIPMPIT